MSGRKRVLIVGGTGVFGMRLAGHLARCDGLELVLTSRNQERAQRVVDLLEGEDARVPISAVALERGVAATRVLRTIKPWLVVDCSGPFQGEDHAFAKAVIEQGLHFFDLADGRDYLLGFSDALNDLALSRGVVALAGASSPPALSHAIVEKLTAGWHRIDTIDLAIVPAGRSEVGPAVIKGVLSYAGCLVPAWRDGKIGQVAGWSESGTIDHPDLGRKNVAIVETMDAELMGPKFNVRERVHFCAGLESGLEQRGMQLISALRRNNMLPDVSRFAGVFVKARSLTRLFATNDGGMVVRVTGLNAHHERTRTQWWLTARKNHGPSVPILPLAAAIEKLGRGDVPAGARLATDVLNLTDIEAQMAGYAITRESVSAGL